MIPVPKTLFHAMGLAPAGADAESPLPGEWNQLASEVAHKPEIVREALSRLPRDESAETIRAVIHVKASRALERLLTEKEHLLSLVDARGKVRWAELLGILPKEQCGAVTLSPLVQYSGGLPLHVAIARIERVKTPLPSILLATESGHSARIGSETPIILEMLWEQLAGLNHPTWSELVGFLKVPKRLETVQATANEILLAHGQTTAKRKSFSDLIASCSLF